MFEIITLITMVAALFMGISIGASSVAATFGPVSSSGAMNVLRAAMIAGIFAFLGSVLQGQNVADTMGSGLLMGEIQVAQAAAILFVAGLLVIVSVLTDYPMPTAFTTTGAIVGSAYGFGDAVNWAELFDVVAYWFVVPFASLIIAYFTAILLQKYIPKDAKKPIRYLLLISASYMAYTTGAGSVGLVAGPMSALGYSQTALLWFGAIAILLGTWMYSPRIIKAVSYDYSNIGPRRSIAALAAGGITAQAGVIIGAPISANLAIIAAVIGSGMVEGKSNNDLHKIGFTVAAWVSAFFMAVLLTALIGYVV